VYRDVTKENNDQQILLPYLVASFPMMSDTH